MMESPRAIYERVMYTKRHGSPNYHPDCNENLPREVRERGTHVGDLGFKRDGCFNYLFNITLPADHPVNRGRVPDGFVPVSIREEVDLSSFSSYFSAPSFIHSSSVTSCDISASAGVEPPVANGILGANLRLKFTRDNSEGAILVLPNGGSRQDILPIKRFKKYIEKHAESWFTFLDNDFDIDELYVVTGCDKASSWGIASFSEASGSFEASILFEAASIGQLNGSARYSWAATSTDCRTGPGDANRFGKDCQNQCVFMRGLRVSLRKDHTTSWLAGLVKIVDETDPSRPATKSRSHSSKSRRSTDAASSSTFRLPRRILSQRSLYPDSPTWDITVDNSDDSETEEEELFHEDGLNDWARHQSIQETPPCVLPPSSHAHKRALRRDDCIRGAAENTAKASQWDNPPQIPIGLRCRSLPTLPPSLHTSDVHFVNVPLSEDLNPTGSDRCLAEHASYSTSGEGENRLSHGVLSSSDFELQHHPFSGIVDSFAITDGTSARPIELPLSVLSGMTEQEQHECEHCGSPFTELPTLRNYIRFRTSDLEPKRSDYCLRQHIVLPRQEASQGRSRRNSDPGPSNLHSANSNLDPYHGGRKNVAHLDARLRSPEALTVLSHPRKWNEPVFDLGPDSSSTTHHLVPTPRTNTFASGLPTTHLPDFHRQEHEGESLGVEPLITEDKSIRAGGRPKFDLDHNSLAVPCPASTVTNALWCGSVAPPLSGLPQREERWGKPGGAEATDPA